jgi:hypothetical protein
MRHGRGARTKGTLELSGSSRRPGDKRTFLVMLPLASQHGAAMALVLRCCARIFRPSSSVSRVIFAPYPPPG